MMDKKTLTFSCLLVSFLGMTSKSHTVASFDPEDVLLVLGQAIHDFFHTFDAWKLLPFITGSRFILQSVCVDIVPSWSTPHHLHTRVTYVLERRLAWRCWSFVVECVVWLSGVVVWLSVIEWCGGMVEWYG